MRQVWGPGLVPPALGRRHPYLEAVRRRQQEALAQLRTGSHWGAEETGRWEHQPREARICPHCQLGVEDATHMIFDCPLYAPQRRRWGDLFAHPDPLLCFSFKTQPAWLVLLLPAGSSGSSPLQRLRPSQVCLSLLSPLHSSTVAQ